MKREDVIRIAHAAGIQGMLTDVVCEFSELERFAALVEAEALKSQQQAINAAVMVERARCAAICEGRAGPLVTGAYTALIATADAIRTQPTSTRMKGGYPC